MTGKCFRDCAMVFLFIAATLTMSGCTFLDTMVSMYAIYAWDSHTKRKPLSDDVYAKLKEELRKMGEEANKPVPVQKDTPSAATSDAGKVPVLPPDEETISGW